VPRLSARTKRRNGGGTEHVADPPFEPRILFHAKKLIAVVGAYHQKIAAVSYHDDTEYCTGQTGPQQNASANKQFVIK
jgi:hypothetical protein